MSMKHEILLFIGFFVLLILSHATHAQDFQLAWAKYDDPAATIEAQCRLNDEPFKFASSTLANVSIMQFNLQALAGDTVECYVTAEKMIDGVKKKSDPSYAVSMFIDFLKVPTDLKLEVP